MKVKYTRTRFDPERIYVVTRPFNFGEYQYIEGDIFNFERTDKRQCTRARQLYEMRRLEMHGPVKLNDVKPDYINVSQ